MAIRIAVVDDEPKIRAAWQRFISKQPDMECVAQLANADGLVTAVADSGVDIVLLDLTMPGVDPFDAIAALCAEGTPCRVLVYSAHRDPDLVERAMGSGAWGFVDKLEPVHAVLDAIRTIANGEVSLPGWLSGFRRPGPSC